MKRDTCVCPDGRVRRKVWHLFAPDDPGRRAEEQDYFSVCGMRVFADDKRGLPGASLPHCFCEDWLKINCESCLRIMAKGLPV